MGGRSGQPAAGATLAELAEAIGARLEGGDPARRVARVAPLDEADGESVSFFHNGRYREQLRTTGAAAVIVADEERAACGVAALVHPHPYLGYALAAERLHAPPSLPAGVHPTAVVDPGARIGADVSIGPGCVIGPECRRGEGCVIGPGCLLDGEVEIGDGGRLMARVTLIGRVVIGRRVLIQPGAVVGSDGFGFVPVEAGAWHKIPQVGGVRIGDDVEIGANTTIDRGALGDTVLEDGVKLDNQIQIAHNVQVGAHTAMAGCVGVAGSARIGRRCRVGGAAVILGHLEVVDDVTIHAMSLVERSILSPGIYSSALPVQESGLWKRNLARLRRLDRTLRERR